MDIVGQSAFSLEGTTVLVTGGLGRLGRAIAAEAVTLGGRVVLTTRDPERARDFNENEGTERLNAEALRFESEDEVEEVLLRVAERHGGALGIVNNAGSDEPYSSVEDTGLDTWARVMTVNVGYAHTLSKLAMAHRDQTGTSKIVNIGSIYGTLAPDFSIYNDDKPPNPVYYGPSKAALIQLTRYLAVYWAGTGVCVNAVSPGGILDDQAPEFLEAYGSKVPMGRMVDRREVANTVCFLLSEASSGITGQNIIIDGGLHAW